MMKVFTAILLALSVTACGAVPWNIQGNAGITTYKAKWECPENPQTPCLKDLHFRDGTESQERAMLVNLPDGTNFDLSASATLAFSGQATRAEVEKSVAQELGDAATPDMVNAIANLFERMKNGQTP